MELRERGWSILAAAGEVGVSRTTGNNWSRLPLTLAARLERKYQWAAAWLLP